MFVGRWDNGAEMILFFFEYIFKKAREKESQFPTSFFTAQKTSNSFLEISPKRSMSNTSLMLMLQNKH